MGKVKRAHLAWRGILIDGHGRALCPSYGFLCSTFCISLLPNSLPQKFPRLNSMLLTGVSRNLGN